MGISIMKQSRGEKRIFKFIKNAHKQAANTIRKKDKKKIKINNYLK